MTPAEVRREIKPNTANKQLQQQLGSTITNILPFHQHFSLPPSTML
jgi:hypothetical protein